MIQGERAFGLIRVAACAVGCACAALALGGCGGGGGSSSSGSALGSSSGAGTTAPAPTASGASAPQPQAFIGGTVTGLRAGTSVGLLNNGAGALSISANGSFQFATAVSVGGAYHVTVATQPSKQVCTVTGGAGSIASSAPVTNVQVSCVANPAYVYVTNAGSNSVSIYTIDETTGKLNALAGGPFGAGMSGAHLVSVLINSACTVAYVLDDANSLVDYDAIAASGALPAQSAAHVASGHSPARLITNPAGTVLDIPNAGTTNTMTVYDLDPVSGVPTAYTASPYGMGGQPEAMAYNPSGNVAYVPNFVSNDFYAFSVGPSGSLVSLLNPSTGHASFFAGAGPSSIAFAPSGAFAYVANTGGNTISAFSVSSSGLPTALTSGGTVAAGTTPYEIVINHAGTFAAVPNEGSNTISMYSINGTTGALTQVTGSPFTTGIQPVGAIFDPTDQYLYVVNMGSNSVLAYSIASSGALTQVSSATTGATPTSIAIGQR